MSRKCLVQRNCKRKKMIEKYFSKREELKKRISNPDVAMKEKILLVDQLNKLPRDSSKVRRRNLCNITGRPKGYYRFFGVCRHKIRELAAMGALYGVTKSSW